MSLTFPTQAEQCAEEFRTQTKTISLTTIAKRMGAMRADEPGKRIYVFEDGTTLEATGTGRALKFETFHP
jgi:hypothetical protein